MASLLLLAVSFHAAAATGAAPPCTALADKWCKSVAAGCPSTAPLRALKDGSSAGPAKAWRCYSPKCLENGAYKQGSKCADYCTRPQLAEIVSTCKLPPPPPPPPPLPQQGKDFISEVFVPGELGYPCIRIPSIILAGDNSTMLAFAECRTMTGDGCLPLHVAHNASHKNPRDLCQKRSSDSGRTWSPLEVIAFDGAQCVPPLPSSPTSPLRPALLRPVPMSAGHRRCTTPWRRSSCCSSCRSPNRPTPSR